METTKSGKPWKDDIFSFIPKKARKAGAIIIFIILIVTLYNYLSMPNVAVSDKRSAPVAPAVAATESEKPLLELLSFHCSSGYGFFEITGEVKNVSDHSLKDVMAEGTARTATGEFVNSSEALLTYNPILPGQTSPFKVIMTNNPEMEKCAVGFKYLFGGQVNTDMSKAK